MSEWIYAQPEVLDDLVETRLVDRPHSLKQKIALSRDSISPRTLVIVNKLDSQK